jgi:hypothetical protein
MEYSFFRVSGDSLEYIKTLSPKTTTFVNEEAYYTTGLTVPQAEEECPNGFSVGPRPHPHS